MLDRADLYDPGLVARLSRWTIPGPPSAYPQRGVHRSPRRGASLEFSEHTEYAPGDDLRHMDWRVYAKTDRLYVKRYEDERLQRAVLLVDASGSMAYGASGDGLRGSKYHRAARWAVAVAACLLRQGDAVGLYVAGGTGAEGTLAPRGGVGHLGAVIEALAGVRPGGEARLEAATRVLADRVGRSAAVFAFSDLLDPEAEALEPFRVLRARGLAPRVCHLLHPDELDLPFEDTTRFLDLEGPAELVLDPLAVRRAYRQEIEAYRRALAARAETQGIPYAFAATHEDPVPPLGRLLAAARRNRWTS
ncbi:MAG: DUF58 domain-containing protein [Candidatus Dadabacteria bacterium]|nr:MAG: DUF58 domain-containing protein [Candidatus Dadabacteria bacterium]